MRANRLAHPSTGHLTKNLIPIFFTRSFLRSPLASILLSMLLITGLSGCFFGRERSATVSAADRPVPVLSDLENKARNVRIAVPEGWVAVSDSQRRSADIYATYPPDELYVLVLSESSEVIGQFGLENNAQQYRWLIKQELDSVDSETRTGLDTLNGHSAVQYEIQGEVNGVPVVYLHTTLRGTNDYYQVVGWTTAASYRDHKAALKAVVESFRGI
ncbi:MAG: hypothetical protein HC800_11235 [Phormidesmis sp. RL_2_1]|nr:hypothetical protein [Phormidesmis sp. RL_2_1]